MQKDTYLCTAVQLSPQKQYIGRLIHVCTAVNVQSPINVYYVNHENVLKMWLYSKDNTTNTIKIRVWTKKNNNLYISFNNVACSVGYISVHFEPSATQKTAHHMLLYGCGLPGVLLPSW